LIQSGSRSDAQFYRRGEKSDRLLGRRLDGQIGAVGAAYTYQAMEYRDEGFWQLLDDYRVFVVFDEIH
ncbi:hypothetical protein ACT01C_32890, partial [Pseudomonas aeruginosa]